MSRIGVHGAELVYDEAGAGPAVVLLHAGCADRRMWEHQFHALAARHRVVRYDWRGYGESDDAVGAFAHHDDLLGLLDALGIERAALVGSSDGGKIALDAALTAPWRVSALALVAPGLSGHEWPPELADRYRREVRGVLAPERARRYRAGEAGALDPALVDADLDVYAEAETRFLVVGPTRRCADVDPEVWRAALAMDRLVNRREWYGEQAAGRGLRPPAKDRLAEVAVPVLVLTGASDVPEILAVSDTLTAGIPGARRVELADTGHLPPLERPAEVTAVLRQFLGAADTEADAEVHASPEGRAGRG
jgi:pimeloyl-ACP methyl ester carboxylesterase